jgi:hypothetical protein
MGFIKRVMNNLISERIEVIAYFHNLNLEILRFKWKDDIFNVSKINSHWRIPSGNGYEYHYTVTCFRQCVVCEISFNLNDFQWELVQLHNIR